MTRRVGKVYFHGSPYERYIFSLGAGGLVLTDRPEDSDMIVLGHHPPDLDAHLLMEVFTSYDVPKVVLAHGAYSLQGLPSPPDPLRGAFHFQWISDPSAARWITALVEDRINADEYVLGHRRRALLLVEDEIPFASQFIPLLMHEIRERTMTLVDPYLSREEKLRAVERQRPVLLLASSFEQAVGFLDRYGDKLVGVISALGFPRDSRNDPRAGLALLARVRSLPMELPMVIMSMREDMRAEVQEAGAAFISKHSPNLLEMLRFHLLDSFGFGDFIFRLPGTRSEVARAGSLSDLKQCLEWIPIESFVYHASRYHFSNWLALHGRLDLAEEIRPIPATEGEMARNKLLRLLDALEQDIHH